MKSYGIAVHMKYTHGGDGSQTFHRTFHNVTEVHFGYESKMPDKRIAIESNIHTTGITFPVKDVHEFYTQAEDKKHPSFCQVHSQSIVVVKQ
jgi:hypothetical protein